jgi:hypothetical protein
MIYAVINDQTNIVENTIVLDEGSTWTPPAGYYIVDITGTEVGIDWTYNPTTKEWTPPVGYVSPQQITEIPGTQPNVIG